MTKTPNLQDDDGLLFDAVEKAGALALETFRDDRVKTWMKKGAEPVTETDLAVNAFLEETLMKERPDYGWLSEESADDKTRLEKDRVWIVDPIDGTRAFIRGNRDFSIVAALLEKGRPVLGAIYAPALEKFYTGRKSKGAYLNGKKLAVNRDSDFQTFRLQGDRNYFTSKKWKTPWPELKYRKFQSFALRVASVAAGEFDAAMSARDKSEWDVAAGDLMVHEAGGICCDGKGNRFLYNQENTRLRTIIATTPNLINPILSQLKERKSKNTS